MSDFDHTFTWSNRREEILRFINECGYVSSRELCSRFFISEPTVRRELAALEQEGLIRRSRGGAVAFPGGLRQSVSVRRSVRQAEKSRIAARAAHLVQDGQLLFLDTSTTVLHMLPALRSKKELTVVTNSVLVMEYLTEQAEAHRIACKCTGGDLQRGSVGLVGRQAERYIAGLRADWMFFSTPCVSNSGRISDYSEQETYLRMAMLENSDHQAYLFDATKYGKEETYTVASLSRLDWAISDLPQPDTLPLGSCRYLYVSE